MLYLHSFKVVFDFNFDVLEIRYLFLFLTQLLHVNITNIACKYNKCFFFRYLVLIQYYLHISTNNLDNQSLSMFTCLQLRNSDPLNPSETHESLSHGLHCMVHSPRAESTSVCIRLLDVFLNDTVSNGALQVIVTHV